MGHTFCLAFPGDGWSSRVLDAVVHGCIPVVIQVHRISTPTSPPPTLQTLSPCQSTCTCNMHMHMRMRMRLVVQDESEMFFEGAFRAAGLPVDYDDFSIRVLEADLPDLVPRLKAVPKPTVRRMERPQDSNPRPLPGWSVHRSPTRAPCRSLPP